MASEVQGTKHVSMQLPRAFSGLTNLFSNKSFVLLVFLVVSGYALPTSVRQNDYLVNNKRKRLRPGKVSPRLPVPDHIIRLPYFGLRQSPGISEGLEVHDKNGKECMRAPGPFATQQPSVKTDEIDKAVHQMIKAYPSPLGYCGFPKSVCTSVNECICHGIPDSHELEVLMET
ncbi:methionine aminopeptidase 1D, chloroplastic/mitochondrial-like [Aristolochia californica]|uniref:methionine aminopeptidase 1D, chloroplastic/mitochondrial-like n=1 Tax=Aristolochia californica TaxID=171875 RepID=UPI0035E31763